MSIDDTMSNNPSNAMDNTIREVERLYQSITGSDVPPEGESAFAAIPPEVDPQRYVEAQVERLMALLGDDAGASPRAMASFVPPLSVMDGEKERVYRLDVPGVQRKDIEVSLVGGALVVRGRRERAGASGQTLRWREAPEGSFERVMPLPRSVDDDELRVSLKDGCLEIRVPTRAAAAPVTLEIQ